MQIRPRYSGTEHPRVSWGRGGSRKCRERKLTFVCSLSVQRVPAYKTCSMQGRHYYELHVTDEQTEEGGFSSVTLVQDRIGNQGCFPDSKSKLLPLLPHMLPNISCHKELRGTGQSSFIQEVPEGSLKASVFKLGSIHVNGPLNAFFFQKKKRNGI